MPLTSCDALTIVFAKAPRAGEVKTRLIPLLGAEGAAALHRQLVHRTLVTATDAGLGPVELHAAFDVNDPFLKDRARRFGVTLVPQRGENLGARMCNAFDEGLARHERVIIVGTDCPVLTVQHLNDAQAALASGGDAVLIPAEDGGYALIGLTCCDARLFDGIAWGGDTVLAATRERLCALRWRWHELETLWDIDRPADYRRWSELVINNDHAPLA
ncbi:MAG TPA: TIGR04282 family arsenosugar biosynthesis glycosyltransferase [Burkholderiales bacterium]|nr:TIGR04282 family arsenosugar biosynthesis glycosyltransferase [Burkholderiales bacterium]